MPSEGLPYSRDQRAAGLVDVLDRVLDKGLVIAGDIRVSLAEVELLTIRIRLLVCSIDKAQEIGLDWWKRDPNLSISEPTLTRENTELKQRIRELETKVNYLESNGASRRTRSSSRNKKR